MSASEHVQIAGLYHRVSPIPRPFGLVPSQHFPTVGVPVLWPVCALKLGHFRALSFNDFGKYQARSLSGEGLEHFQGANGP